MGVEVLVFFLLQREGVEVDCFLPLLLEEAVGDDCELLQQWADLGFLGKVYFVVSSLYQCFPIDVVKLTPRLGLRQEF